MGDIINPRTIRYCHEINLDQQDEYSQTKNNDACNFNIIMYGPNVCRRVLSSGDQTHSTITTEAKNDFIQDGRNGGIHNSRGSGGINAGCSSGRGGSGTNGRSNEPSTRKTTQGR